MLASSSVAALLIGGGSPAALAASCTSVSATYNNTGTVSGICVTTSFSGYISNAGKISATGITLTNGTITGYINSSGIIIGGISIDSKSQITSATTAISITGPTFTGGISNAGTISTPAKHYGIFVGGTTGSGAANVTTFSSGITNAGTISAGATGIIVNRVSVFSGGISNGGTITSSGHGIYVNATTFSDGITNAGTISAPTDVGIQVAGGSSFSGNIVNSASGSISSKSTGILVNGVSNFSGGITNSGTITSTSLNGIYVTGVSNFSGSIVNSAGGSITATNGAGIALASVTTFTGNISNAGTITAYTGIAIAGSSIGGAILDSGNVYATVGITVDSASTITATVGAAIAVTGPTFTGGITNAGALTGVTAGILVSGVSSFSGGITNSGMISAAGNGISVDQVSTFAAGISNSGTITAGAIGIAIDIPVHYVSTFTGGITNSGLIAGNTGIVVGSYVSTFSGAIVNSGTISGSGGIAIDVSGANNAITINQTAGLISGAIKLSANADVLTISGGTIAGNIVGSGTQDVVNFNLGSGTFTYGAAFGFSTISAVNVNSGIVILDGANSATNITVAGGDLTVGDASNTGASLTGTVDVTGGILSGHGTVDGAVTIENGGMLMPGGSIGTLTISGSLVFNNGSFYAIQLSPAAHSQTNVTGAPGTATINGGTVILTPHLGNYGATTFAILTASNGVIGTPGTFNPTIAYSGTIRLRDATLSYDANDVYLSYAQTTTSLTAPAGAGTNQQNVVNGINNFLFSGGTPPAGFQTLAGLSGPALLNALTQLSGEATTDAEKGAFQLMVYFLDLANDTALSLGGGSTSGGSSQFAPEQQASFPPDVALAYNSVLRAPPAPSFDQRWNVWASGFGGSSTFQGNATLGSNNVTANVYGFAAGMDYRSSPDTVLGFALAGGGTSWGLAQGLGGGRSDAFQAGVYGATHLGPAYVSGALAVANYWMSTNRIALGDQLTASFDAQSYAGRLEAGYRYAVPANGAIVGIAPYAAVQPQLFRTPGYSETDLTGGGLGLSYGAMNATDIRSELGARLDNLTAWGNMPLIWHLRAAWAHDWVSNPALGAVFQALPGSNFTVNGAVPPKDSALVTAGGELRLTPSWSFSARLYGEFAPTAQTYAGTGTLRYTW